MEKDSELIAAINDIKICLEGHGDPAIRDAIVALEGIVPFIDKNNIVDIKCKGCDNYALSSFPSSDDLCAIDNNDYCHANRLPMDRLAILAMAGCTEFSQKAQKDLERLGSAILEEDLKPAFEDRKLYDKKRFASYKVSFRMRHAPGNVCIEFGYESDSEFTPSDLLLCILRRLDPGFGPLASEKIAGVLKDRPILFVAANKQTRRQMDIDYILDWTSKKRKLDIVYL